MTQTSFLVPLLGQEIVTVPQNDSQTQSTQEIATETTNSQNNAPESTEHKDAIITGAVATYSPEDNKLRLRTPSRVNTETFDKLKGLGFKWAPAQKLFVAPSWTPSREDFLIKLCGEINDEDESLIEKAKDRADRFNQYSQNRQQDALDAKKSVSAISDHIPFGQPILVGHHSERRARKDAERIESGMRKVVKMWEQSEYWSDRAEAAIRHAKYKELPGVRYRRIKSIEAEKRKMERSKKECELWLERWSKENLTLDEARQIADYCHLRVAKTDDHCWYAYDVLSRNGIPNGCPSMTIAEIQGIAKRGYPITIAHCNRWINHYNNRLTYERAMLGESGGLASQKFDLQPGGQVLRRHGDWFVITKVNKVKGVINSVSVLGHFASTIGVDEIKDYRAPKSGDAEKVEAISKIPPLCNYPGEGFIHLTKSEFKSRYGFIRAIYPSLEKHSIYKIEKKYAPHRVRFSIRSGNMIAVFLTDEKTKHPPLADETTPKPELKPIKSIPSLESKSNINISDDVRDVLKSAEITATSVKLAENIDRNLYLKVNKTLECLGGIWSRKHKAHIFTSDPRELLGIAVKTGGIDIASLDISKCRNVLKTGIQSVVVPNLFPTPPDLAKRMIEYAGGILAGLRILEPSAGTGVILKAIFDNASEADCVDVVAVEINSGLVNLLKEDRNLRFGANESNYEIHCMDFLQFSDEKGFDCILMNPPFDHGSDIKHILHAFTLLKTGGTLVSICANGPKQKKELMPLVEEKGGEWIDLDPGTFKESGTMVNTAMVVIPKN